jgi:hypothetical protein
MSSMAQPFSRGVAALLFDWLAAHEDETSAQRRVAAMRGFTVGSVPSRGAVADHRTINGRLAPTAIGCNKRSGLRKSATRVSRFSAPERSHQRVVHWLFEAPP